MADTREDIISGLGDIIAEEIGGRASGITATSTITGDLDLDSLSRLTIATHAEDVFGVAIPDDDIDAFVTVGDLADFIVAARGGATPAGQ